MLCLWMYQSDTKDTRSKGILQNTAVVVGTVYCVASSSIAEHNSVLDALGWKVTAKMLAECQTIVWICYYMVW